MARRRLNAEVRKSIADSVLHYKAYRTDFDRLARVLFMELTEDQALQPLIHSAKYRTKDPDHLSHKLERIAQEAHAKGKAFSITTSNLFRQIGDLAGVRILHLHTSQIADLHPATCDVLSRNNYRTIGKPTAFTWDIENETFYNQLGFRTLRRPTLYTSVHYNLESASRPGMRMELQVRTLSEELWG